MTIQAITAASSTQLNSVMDQSPTLQPSTPIGFDGPSDRTDSISVGTNAPTSLPESTNSVTLPSQTGELSTQIVLP